MTNRPFSIQTLGIDILISVGSVIIGGIISAIICIALTGSRENGLGATVYLAFPLISTIYFLLRRQFNYPLTIIQIILTSLIVFGLTYLTIKQADHLPMTIEYDYLYLIWFILPIYFVLTKHSIDKLTMFLKTNTKAEKTLDIS